MFTPQAVLAAVGLTESEIFGLIESAEIHFCEGPKVYVCLNSLSAINKGKEM